MNKHLKFAKDLRKNSTQTERRLWKYLRAKRFQGIKFRRQEPIGPYIVDFICYESRLIIECDGGQHASQKEKDQKRDQWLVTQGFRVLRFWDNEVLKNTDIVMQVIYDAVNPSPRPSPARGEGEKIP